MGAIREILAQQRPRMGNLGLGVAGALLCSCGPPHSHISDFKAGEPVAASILSNTTPAADSMVAAPVNELVFDFDPPARLGEVTVIGPEGLMPMMVTAVGEAQRYSIPVHGLGPGGYTVRWTATIAGQDYEGSFRFTAR